MVDNKLLPKLSQNFLELLEDEEYYDTTIEVGNDPDKNDGTLINIKLPNFLPDVFHLILRYIYGGKLSFEEYDILDIIKILTTANELGLQELTPFIETFLIKNKKDLIEQNFDLIYRISFENNSFLELRKYCNDIISKTPNKIFNSSRFTSISEKLLVTIIQNDKLQMNEVQVWEHVIKWGLAQNPELSHDPQSYSKEEFIVLRNTLQQCIPFIRFYNFTSKEFSDNIVPYKRILPKKLYKNLLKDFLSSNYKLTEKSRPRAPRVIEEIEEKFDSKIIDLKHTELISKWIDRLEITDKTKNHYEFKLLYRNKYVGENFHNFCDNQPGTVTIVKLKDSDEILGGYNPLEWKSCEGYRSTKDSFIFSFKNGYDIENHILSRVKDEAKAIYNGNFGPSFGCGDLHVSNLYELKIRSVKSSYEKSIAEEGIDIEEYEVFKVVRA
ncbi:carbohydrate-binding module family 13 protein [Rhizophagus clarus]|uniref:Carbohydrate-binding module family 13 protein n=1 Tax=Rhizophagus clarus TaxID=94130 RepID=A0A8H3LDU3_9GLOM|nr:carbohydrate-binding module family 13 protein [Rhizophagus clarus]